MLPAFVTGSHVYGFLHEESDIDLVILVSPADLQLLKAQENLPPGVAGVHEDSSSKLQPEWVSKSTPLRFGKLNLIACTCPIVYAVWSRIKMELENAGRRFTRDDAVAYHKKVFATYNPYTPTPEVPDEEASHVQNGGRLRAGDAVGG